ncbi:MAG: hypothetical protein KAT74_06700, partial [Candidatus Cloacimonetes bacterium]|nr:hypothetical protein [Candidatus Cloacimonadota bacterium]
PRIMIINGSIILVKNSMLVRSSVSSRMFHLEGTMYFSPHRPDVNTSGYIISQFRGGETREQWKTEGSIETPITAGQTIEQTVVICSKINNYTGIFSTLEACHGVMPWVELHFLWETT